MPIKPLHNNDISITTTSVEHQTPFKAYPCLTIVLDPHNGSERMTVLEFTIPVDSVRGKGTDILSTSYAPEFLCCSGSFIY